MLEITTSATTSLTPEQVIGAAADFSGAREKLWSNSKDKYLRVHDQGADFAEVTEGLRMIGVFWERSRYDWSEAGTIRQTVLHLSREFRPSIKGRVGWTLNHLAGARMWGSYVRRALADAESRC